MNGASFLSSKEIPQRPFPASAMGSVAFETLLSQRASAIFCVWDARLVFLHTPFKQTVTLVLDAVSSDLETHWTKNVYNLFFPLDFLFFYWFSIFSTRLITSQIPIYIQILLNSASYILGTFSSINQFFKERDSIIRSVPDDTKMAYREQTQGARSLIGWAQLICEHNNYEVNVVGWYRMGKFIFCLLPWPRVWTANLGQLSYNFTQ